MAVSKIRRALEWKNKVYATMVLVVADALAMCVNCAALSPQLIQDHWSTFARLCFGALAKETSSRHRKARCRGVGLRSQSRFFAPQQLEVHCKLGKLHPF